MTVRPLPGCEPRAEVQQTIEQKLSEPTLQRMKFGDRVRFRREVLEDLIAKYPRELEPHPKSLGATPAVAAAIMCRACVGCGPRDSNA